MCTVFLADYFDKYFQIINILNYCGGIVLSSEKSLGDIRNSVLNISVVMPMLATLVPPIFYWCMLVDVVIALRRSSPFVANCE